MKDRETLKQEIAQLIYSYRQRGSGLDETTETVLNTIINELNNPHVTGVKLVPVVINDPDLKVGDYVVSVLGTAFKVTSIDSISTGLISIQDFKGIGFPDTKLNGYFKIRKI